MNPDRRGCELIITIVDQGAARKVVEASKRARAEGGTTFMGRGTAGPETATLFGIEVEPEKELVLTLVDADRADDVWRAISATAGLGRPGRGVACVVDVRSVCGICHQCGGAIQEMTDKAAGSKADDAYDLIVTIVNRGDIELAIEASRCAGAEGGTIVCGRGTGVHEHAKLWGITLEPEKEMLLTLMERSKTRQVLEAIIAATELDKPGKGIAFVLGVTRVAGISHAGTTGTGCPPTEGSS